jgi:hypothetical protein
MAHQATASDSPRRADGSYVLAPLVAAENAAAMWADLDLSRKRAVIKTLMSVALRSPGRGARRPFDPATVEVTWKQPDAV